jgi:hypothetical protein
MKELGHPRDRGIAAPRGRYGGEQAFERIVYCANMLRRSRFCTRTSRRSPRRRSRDGRSDGIAAALSQVTPPPGRETSPARRFRRPADR